MQTFKSYTYGDPEAENILIQMADDHDLAVIEQEISFIQELAPGKRFFLKAYKVNDWNHDLSPWPAPAVFGNEDFGDGAKETLEFILSEAVPERRSKDLSPDGTATSPEKKYFIGGYSLAGLFALWAVCQTDVFSGAAAASPSVWFPGFTEYARSRAILTDHVYLSLGDREEKTRNPVMAQVGNAIRDLHALLEERGICAALEWNRGNHFKEPDLRTAKAFAWVLLNS